MNTVVATSADPLPRSVRNMMWLLKRELWENRGRLIITPLVIAGLFILGTMYALVLAGHVQIGDLKIGQHELETTHQHFDGAYLAFAVPVALVMAIVTLNYALDALYTDRRDRSVLFWKSLPISDVHTVLSKLLIAAVIAPTIGAITVVATQLVINLALSIFLAAKGFGFGLAWALFPPLQNTLVLLQGLLIAVVWYLPIWAWCLMVSAWATRTPFLWATLPFGALAILEWVALRTHHVVEFVGGRLGGGLPFVTGVRDVNRFSVQFGAKSSGASQNLLGAVDWSTFLSSAQVWGGVIVALAMLSATVWLRRYRETA